ncbi:Aureobasidin resistance protein Aur1 [Allomyces arbusculus]|nr:Aureobasidin resistance protein Aur1 [Allomyces arbusculus]
MLESASWLRCLQSGMGAHRPMSARRPPWLRSIVLPLGTAAAVILCFVALLLVASSIPVAVRLFCAVCLSFTLCTACLHALRDDSSDTPIAAMAAPLVAYVALFLLPRHLPDGILPDVNTTALPAIDTALIGQPAPALVRATLTTAQDVTAWLFYGVLHFASPVAIVVVGIAFGVWCRIQRREYARVDPVAAVADWKPAAPAAASVAVEMEADFDRTAASSAATENAHLLAFTAARQHRHAPVTVPPAPLSRSAQLLENVKQTLYEVNAAAGLLKVFLVVFASSNLTGVMIQYLFPSAAPWYNEKYGTAPPDNMATFKGEPGGLARIDELFGMDFYHNLFANSPLVFGAFPSLHAGYATIVSLFFADQFRWIRLPWFRIPSALVGGIYTLGMCWSTMYLNHHFLTDLLGGTSIALSFYFYGRSRIRRVAAAMRSGEHWVVLAEETSSRTLVEVDEESAVFL